MLGALMCVKLFLGAYRRRRHLARIRVSLVSSSGTLTLPARRPPKALDFFGQLKLLDCNDKTGIENGTARRLLLAGWLAGLVANLAPRFLQ